ncbi:ankyrin repeat-containing domain protein [Lanmaoa asiatica]|nr:ankyrin repeat-containing domain protein [Lanmaoa asiatica]
MPGTSFLSLIRSTKHPPIHIAAQKGYISVVDDFLALGVSLPPDILLAASTGYSKKIEVIRYLIEKGADVSIVTTDGDTPLHLSVTEGSQDDCLACVKLFIDAGCNPRAQNSNNETPMNSAARHGSTSVLEYLLSQGVPLPNDVSSTSAPSTFRFVVGKCVDVRCVVSNVDTQLMHRALDYYDEEDCLECAKILVGKGWNPLLRNSAGERPIHVTVRWGQLSTIKYLLSHCDNAPLPSDVLLSAVLIDRWYPNWTVISLFNFLVREGASVNATKSNGDTPLHLVLRSKLILDEDVIWYARMELWKAVEILLDCGADPSTRNVDDQRPIDIADSTLGSERLPRPIQFLVKVRVFYIGILVFY